MEPINNKDKYFKGQQSNETLICFVRHHWMYLLKEIMYFLILFLVVALTLANIETIKELLRGNRELKMLFLTGFCILTIFIHRFFIKILNYFVNIGIITDKRFIDHQKTIFFKDTMDSIDMRQIQNIESISNGILPNLLGYGDIKIFLSASSAVKTYSCIPNIKFHYRCLNRLKEAREKALLERTQVNVHDVAGRENARIFQPSIPQNDLNDLKDGKPIPFEFIKK